jgi:hypothetical protein
MGRGDSKTSKKRDNLEAARTVRDALKGFERGEQEQILRWAAESLGITPQLSTSPPQLSRLAAASSAPPHIPVSTAYVAPAHKAVKDIATFVNDKNPQTDIQLATTIAYYYRFEAPEAERKNEIDADVLRDACRLAGKPGRLVKPLTTLNNAHAGGYLDRGARGKFSINTVGENLVGMTLPANAAARQKAPKK